ncbi:MAG TPA: hypothetical protein VEQ37_04060 [Actinomycetota bacterium]|nr:hypothetical protein [Actinomycetota bacterium]
MGARVLVVQSDLDDRDLIGSWLEAEGYDVASCPGPTRPEYTCVGSRTQRCPLVEEAELVVLDLVLDSDIAMEGPRRKRSSSTTRGRGRRSSRSAGRESRSWATSLTSSSERGHRSGRASSMQ